MAKMIPDSRLLLFFPGYCSDHHHVQLADGETKQGQSFLKDNSTRQKETQGMHA